MAKQTGKKKVNYENAESLGEMLGRSGTARLTEELSWAEKKANELLRRLSSEMQRDDRPEDLPESKSAVAPIEEEPKKEIVIEEKTEPASSVEEKIDESPKAEIAASEVVAEVVETVEIKEKAIEEPIEAANEENTIDREEEDMQKIQSNERKTKNTEVSKTEPLKNPSVSADQQKSELPSFIKRRPDAAEESKALPSFIKRRPTEEERVAPTKMPAPTSIKLEKPQNGDKRTPRAPRLGPDGKPLPPRDPRAPRLGPDGKPLPPREPRAPRLGPDGKPLPPREPRAVKPDFSAASEVPALPVNVAKDTKKNFTEPKKKPGFERTEKKPINKRALVKQQGVSVEDFDEDKSGYRKMRGAKKSKQQEVQKAKIEHAVVETTEISIKDLSEKLGITAVEITKRLFKENIMKTINETIDYDNAALIAADLGIELEYKPPKTAEDLLNEAHDTEEDIINDLMITRAPIVTVMGHVDHGKTSLLDAIRKTNVTAGEAGGITQHIGAYSVTINDQQITFLDTPGHEAFTAMRARGANVTDVVILVVAADDGIMPQTIEAINHAKAANVPIVVAINKMDKYGATPDRIKIDLMNHGLVPEEYGGDTIVVPVSAKTGMGIDDLLENVLVSAEMLELGANPDREAQGAIIEAKLDKGKGPVASVLVLNGTLHTGDSVISGTTVGKIRAMIDDKGRTVKSAGPSMAVSILGLEEVPNAGDQFYAVDPALMKKVVEERKNKEREAMVREQEHVTLDQLFGKIAEGETKTLNLIVKGDVQGSVEAIKQSLVKLSNEEVRVSVIHSGAGAITESDVMLADSSKAIILGFNVRPDTKAKALAERSKVDVRSYRIIYDLLDDIEAAMNGMLTPKYEEVYMGKCEVRQTFKITGVGNIAGCYVLDGKIVRNCKLRIYREDIMIVEGNVQQLKRFKDDVKEVNAGYECGCAIEGFNGIMIGDIIECYSVEEIKRQI